MTAPDLTPEQAAWQRGYDAGLNVARLTQGAAPSPALTHPPEALREAALLVLQSQRLPQKKRMVALGVAINSLRSALDYPAPSPALTRDSDELRKAVEALHRWDVTKGWAAFNDIVAQLDRALLSAGAKAGPTHSFDHDGMARHHHHDQTHEAVWWLNVEQFGGEKREHNHGVGDKAEAPLDE